VDTKKNLNSINDVIRIIEKKNGGVILLHDFNRRPENVIAEKYVLELTRKLIKVAKEKEWKIKKIGDLMNEIGIR
jgi:hypothetical protein